MSHPQGLGKPIPTRRRDELDALTAFTAVVEGWRVIVTVVTVVAVPVLVLLLLQPKRYAATMTVSTVSSGATAAGGIAASLLGASLQGGLQPTPPLVAELAELPGVLRNVATSPVPGRPGVRVIDAIARNARTDSIPDERVPEVMGKIIQVSVQRETGTITLTVAHNDSALARLIADRVVNEVRQTFVTAVRAQASELRLAQARRVDSASSMLAEAEQRYVAFLAHNRTVAPFSPAEVERQRLTRLVQIAQQVYMQAITDREAAVAKELQDTPVLVVIDPMPAVLPSIPRHRLLKLLLTFLLAASVAALGLVFRESIRGSGPADVEARGRFMAAVGNLPVLGWRLRRRPTA